jgi:hypothetical protein
VLFRSALPDDAFCVTRGNEIWSFVSERVEQRNTATFTAATRATYGADIVTQDMANIGAWDSVSKTWRAILPRPQEMVGDRAWRGLYDQATDRFIIPLASSFLIISGAGADVSPRYGASNVLMDYGNYDFHSSGIVQNGRTAYVYDKAHGALYSFNLDAWPFVLTKVLDLPAETYTGGGPGISIVWQPDVQAVVIGGLRIHAYEVNTGKLTSWTRPDGFVNGAGVYVPPATMFYDPDTRDVMSIGGIDWDTSMASSVYWRLKITP